MEVHLDYSMGTGADAHPGNLTAVLQSVLGGAYPGPHSLDPDRAANVVSNLERAALGLPLRDELPGLPDGRSRIDENYRKYPLDALLMLDDTVQEAVAQWLEKGNTPPNLAAWVYFKYSNWSNIVSDPRYRPISEACRKSFIGVIPATVMEMQNRGISQFFSMGPTPDLDVRILESFADRKQKVTYHPVDINSQALAKTYAEIRKILEENPQIEKYIQLANWQTQFFDQVRVEEPACLSYPGGQIANDPNFLSAARTILGNKSGLVVVDVHMNYSSDPDFWLQRYDIGPERRMFRDCILALLPGLRDENGWGIEVNYRHNMDGLEGISFDFRVDKPIRTHLGRRPIIISSGLHQINPSYKFTPRQLGAYIAENGFRMIAQSSVPIGGNPNAYAMTAALYYPGIM